MTRFALIALLTLSLVSPTLAQPVVFEYYYPEAGTYFPIPAPDGKPLPNIFIPSLSTMPTLVRGEKTMFKGKVAVRFDDTWRVVKTKALTHSNGYPTLEVFFHDYGTFRVGGEAIAYPIDPLMEISDIDGATIIKLNADSTAWEFYHAEPEDHHDRELAIQAAIVGAFQRTLDNANLDVIRHRKNAAVQNAKILAYGRLIEFRDDWVGYAIIAEQRKHIGHHVQDSTYVHECVIDSFNDAIAEWKKNKATAWTPISYAVDTVARRRITTLFAYPAPWNHPTRQVIRNLKKAKAEAEAGGE